MPVPADTVMSVEGQFELATAVSVTLVELLFVIVKLGVLDV